MKKENKHFAECMEEMQALLAGFAALGSMEEASKSERYNLAQVLGVMVADLGPKAEWTGTAQYVGRCLAEIAGGVQAGWMPFEDARELAGELVSFLPEGWLADDVDGFWARAVDVARGAVPMSSWGLAMA